MSGLTRTGQLVGTIDYVAPEQIKGEPIDGRADVYSLGCVLFECLTGRVPYERDIEVASLWAHVQEPPPKATEIVQGLPKEIDGVIADAMAKDPVERTASPGEVASELGWALGLEAPTPPGASGQRSTPRVRTKHRGRATLVALVVGVIVAGGAIGGFLLSRGGSSGGFVPGVNTVARIDSSTNTFGEPILSGGQDPTGVALDEGGDVWVINQTSSTVTRIDGQTLTPGTPTSTRGIPTGIAAGEGAVWITNSFGGESGTPQVVQVNLADGLVTPAFESPTASEIVVAFGSIWLADGDRDRVLRYDPRDLTSPPTSISSTTTQTSRATRAISRSVREQPWDLGRERSRRYGGTHRPGQEPSRGHLHRGSAHLGRGDGQRRLGHEPRERFGEADRLDDRRHGTDAHADRERNPERADHDRRRQGRGLGGKRPGARGFADRPDVERGGGPTQGRRDRWGHRRGRGRKHLGHRPRSAGVTRFDIGLNVT